MIGVAANDAEMASVAEFFELFKTPWERAVPGRHYDVLLSTDGRDVDTLGTLTLIYGSSEVPFDRRCQKTRDAVDGTATVQWGQEALPLYGPVATFGLRSDAILTVGAWAADYGMTCGSRSVHRIGYDLFHEVTHLLNDGQPPALAAHPTLEVHIALLKKLLETAGVSYVEIPPRPEGADFICCLTHDIDFYGIRRHGLDRTTVGFLWRGTFGTIVDVLRRRRPLAEGMKNLLAAVSLPLVLLGSRRDLWEPLDDYAQADRGLPATFFIIPFKGHPGVDPGGKVVRHRAVKYGARDIEARLRTVQPECEIALHGLDAWRDGTAGRRERAELADATDHASGGVRMHWLYFSSASAAAIEQAGFHYDSTCGYNETVGYKAGTMQAFLLPGCVSLLELPMAVMDTAMFYPDYMNLDRSQALQRMRAIVADAEQFGGALVVNWHDRSLVPERQWQDAYAALLDELQAKRVWFATAADAVRWFGWRRGVRFSSGATAGAVAVECPPAPEDLPPLRLVSRHSSTQFSGVEERTLQTGTTVVM